MIAELVWNTPDDNKAAWDFFAQHRAGVRELEQKETPGVKPKYEGDPGIPGGRPFIAVTAGDGTVRFCYAGCRWTFDGRDFKAVRRTPAQVKL